MKLTTKQIVEKNRADYLGAQTHTELKALFERDGLATKQRWNKAVQAVIDIGGIDYYAASREQRAAAADALKAAVTHEVTLFVDAKARCQQFAITDGEGEVLWFSTFFDNDYSFSFGDSTEQSACECAAARKAIWLASKVKEAVGAQAIRLTLKVDANWLCTLSGKASVLASDARRFNIDLAMEWIAGTSNPADKWTTVKGYKKWSDNDLAALAEPMFAEETLVTQA